MQATLTTTGSNPTQAPTPDRRGTALTDHRPWGQFTRYTHNESTTVKVITVDAGEALSAQRHAHRDELWIALDVGLVAEIDGQMIMPTAGQEMWIPRGTKHRIGSRGSRARFLEIAFGIFDEEDIERFSDRYGRALRSKGFLEASAS